MENVVLTVHLILAVLLIGVVLLQRSEGGGLGMGGGGGSGVMTGRQAANALGRLGVKQGERVATLAWNGYRHFELYYAISGAGSVMHTINPRLFPEQVAWIVNHAEDQVLFFDLTFAPLVDAVAAKCPTVKAWVAMTDRAHLPEM